MVASAWDIYPRFKVIFNLFDVFLHLTAMMIDKVKDKILMILDVDFPLLF